MHRPQHAHRKQVRNDAADPMPDGAVFIGLAMIGLFGVALGAVGMRIPWQHSTLGFLTAVIFLANLYGWRACRGHALPAWGRALARLPLRFAGFGVRGERPLTAAKGDPRARLAMLVASVVSAAVLLAAAAILLA
jgi:hypothetical protein